MNYVLFRDANNLAQFDVEFHTNIEMILWIVFDHMRNLHTLRHNIETTIDRLLNTWVHFRILVWQNLRTNLKLIFNNLKQNMNDCIDIWNFNYRHFNYRSLSNNWLQLNVKLSLFRLFIFFALVFIETLTTKSTIDFRFLFFNHLI